MGYIDKDRDMAVTGAKDIKHELMVVYIIDIALSVTPSISRMVTRLSVLIEITYNSSQKKSKSEVLGADRDNPFFNLGGMGNYDACVAQGEYELK